MSARERLAVKVAQYTERQEASAQHGVKFRSDSGDDARALLAFLDAFEDWKLRQTFSTAQRMNEAYTALTGGGEGVGHG